jgi:hypothetical protein
MLMLAQRLLALVSPGRELAPPMRGARALGSALIVLTAPTIPAGVKEGIGLRVGDERHLSPCASQL